MPDRADNAAIPSGGQQIALQTNGKMTHGEARVWARGFRKLGFSPVTVHQGENGEYELRCNFPYDLSNLPEDLRVSLRLREDCDLVLRVYSHSHAEYQYARFRAVRLGLGSKPIPVLKRHQDQIGYEANVAPAGRILYVGDDWQGMQQHPDWERFLRDKRAEEPSVVSSDEDVIVGSKHDQPRFACPCCGYYTLPEAPPGTYQICPVCFWEDDYLQFIEMDYCGGANRTSLVEARRNFSTLGNAQEHSKEFVRPPRPEEAPPAF